MTQTPQVVDDQCLLIHFVQDSFPCSLQLLPAALGVSRPIRAPSFLRLSVGFSLDPTPGTTRRMNRSVDLEEELVTG